MAPSQAYNPIGTHSLLNVIWDAHVEMRKCTREHEHNRGGRQYDNTSGIRRNKNTFKVTSKPKKKQKNYIATIYRATQYRTPIVHQTGATGCHQRHQSHR